MMDTAPTADLVYQGICTLFHNTNPKEKEKANKWLEEFQKSVSFIIKQHMGSALTNRFFNFIDLFLDNSR